MPTEVDELIVRLSGDASEFKRMMKDSVSELKNASGSIKKASEGIESFKGKLEGLASTAASVFAAIGLGGGLDSLLKTWNVQEEALISLRAQLTVTGQEVESSMETFQTWASSIQAATTFGDEFTLQLAAQAHAFGAVGQSARTATEQALLLSQVSINRNPQAALRLTAAVAQGNIQLAMTYGRIIPELRGVTSETQFLQRYQALLAAGQNTLRLRSQTAAFAMTQLSNTWGDAKEILGQIVAQGLIPFARWMRVAIDAFHALDPETKAMIANTVVFTMAVAGLSSGLRVLAALSLLIQRRFILLLALSAGVAYLMQQFGGFGQVMQNIEGSINNALQIDPQAAFSAQNGMFNAGMGMGEALEKGLSKGSEGVEGILLGTAAAAGAIFGYVNMLRGGKVPTAPAPSVSGVTLPTPKGPKEELFGEVNIWDRILKYAREFWNNLPSLANAAWIAVRDFVIQVFTQIRDFVLDAINRIQNPSSIQGPRPPLNFPAPYQAIPPGGGGQLQGAALQGAQHGGFLSANHAFLIGEAGPEVFVPFTPGHVVPLPQQRPGPQGAGSPYTLSVLTHINENLKLIRRQKLMVGVGRIG